MKKHLRKLVIGDRNFAYYTTDWDLMIISSDKKFSVKLRHLFTPWDAKPNGFTPMEIKGSEFPNYPRAKGEVLWVKYPSVITDLNPGTVRQILDWCFDAQQKVEFFNQSDFIVPEAYEERIRVDVAGLHLPPGDSNQTH